MHTLRWAALALAGVLAVTVTAPARAQNVDIKPTAKVKHDKYVLTAEEIAERSDITNAYDAVRLLRPNFLKQTRSKGMLGQGGSAAYRPPRDQKPSGGEPGAGSGGGAPAAPDPLKPDPSMGAGGSDPAGGTSPFGSASGGGTYVSAVLYVDDVKQSAIEELKNLRVAEVKEIRYMTGTEASGRYGAGHEGGAILVKTNRGG